VRLRRLSLATEERVIKGRVTVETRRGLRRL